MTNNRRVYYRKKGKGKISIEGKSNKKSVHILTLPEPITLIKAIIQETPFLTNEKCLKIKEKVKRLDIKIDKPKNKPKKFV